MDAEERWSLMPGAAAAGERDRAILGFLERSCAVKASRQFHTAPANACLSGGGGAWGRRLGFATMGIPGVDG